MVDQVRAWHPEVPWLREVFHATTGHAYPLHTHDDWTVMLLDDGVVAYDLDRTGHHVSPAAPVLLPPGVPHDGHSALEGKTYRKRVLYLDPAWLPQQTTGQVVDHPTLARPDVANAVRTVHAALGEPADPLAAEQALLVLRGRLLRLFGTPASATADRPLARRLRSLLDDRLTESFTIAEVAADLHTHPSHLVRTFSQAYGIAPHQYVVGRRVDHARRLLLDGHRPAEVAALAGFYDQAHLTRQFRRTLGTTPGAFAGRIGS